MTTFLVSSSHFFSYYSFVLDLSKTEICMCALFLTINKFVLSDWKIDCKWIAMKNA